MTEYRKVKERDKLVRDMSTHAVLNTNREGLLAHKRAINNQKKLDKIDNVENNIELLRKDIADLKKIMLSIGVRVRSNLFIKVSGKECEELDLNDSYEVSVKRVIDQKSDFFHNLKEMPKKNKKLSKRITTKKLDNKIMNTKKMKKKYSRKG